MRKLLILLLFITSAAYGQNTVTLPASTVARSWSVRTLGTDTLRQHWINDGLGYNRYLSATEALRFLRGKVDSTRLFNTVLPLYVTLAGSQSITGKKTFAASTTGGAFFNLTPGVSPTTPTDGDIWFSNTTGLSSRVGGTSYIVTYNNIQQTMTNKVFSTSNVLMSATPTQGDNSTRIATTAYVDAAVVGGARTRVLLSTNVTGILNADYLNNTANTYSIQTPPCGIFTVDGSKIITGLQIGTGKIRVTCPVGYTIQTPSGFVTPSTGYAELIQNQKFQLIPVGTNAYYLQVLNGSITVT